MRYFQNFLPSNQIPTVSTIRRFPALWLILLIVAPGFYAHGQMKLLAPGTGWVRYGDSVFFTRDNGAHWNNITPHAQGVPKAAKIGPIFFRDGSEGWAVESYQERTAPTPEAMRNAKTLYVVLHTEDSGESWDSWPLTYPALPEWIEATFAGPVSLYFLDSMHGWLDVGFQSMSRPGKLLATDDGGQTWNWVGSPVHNGLIYFHSLDDGWLISDAGARELYVTHDGAKSWQEVRLKPPATLGQAVYPTFLKMPKFTDSQNGYLAVQYLGPNWSSPTLVVYVTHSGGRSWEPIKTIPVPATSQFALTNSVVILPSGAGKGKPSTESVPLTTPAQPARPVSSQTRYSILRLSFLDENRGWVFKTDGLYSTGDGGATWKRISPPSPSLPGRQIIIRPSSAPGKSTGTTSEMLLAAPSGRTQSTAHISRHLGFDREYVASVSEMAAWWQSSPYYDVGIYLNGSHNRALDNNLNADWVAQVQSQGWGIIPTWFGLQAPCANASWPEEFTVANAASMGQSEADSAAAAAAALGLQNSVIYKDMENYNTADTECSSAVIAFVEVG